MLLLTPGPVFVPPFILQAISEQPIYHRSTRFEEMFAEIQVGLQYLFQTKSCVLTLIGSGTTGMNAAIHQFVKQGEEVLVSNFGKFSGRWAQQLRSMEGVKVREVKNTWGESPSVQEICAALSEKTSVLILTHCETSTGALANVEEIAFAVRQTHPEILIMVDAISSVGALPYYHDAWGIDVSVTAGQKALMNPAGTAFIALSTRALELLPEKNNSSESSDLGNYVKALQKNNYPFSPPVQLLYGIRAALNWIQEKTLAQRWNEVHQAASFTRKKLKALGAEIYPQMPADSLTTFSFPDFPAQTLVEHLYQNGLELAGGQDELAGKILRIAHLALYSPKITEEALSIIEKGIVTCRTIELS